jgi:hypothetical protein
MAKTVKMMPVALPAMIREVNDIFYPPAKSDMSASSQLEKIFSQQRLSLFGFAICFQSINRGAT